MTQLSCAVALGSNLGDSAQTLTQAIATLAQHPHLSLQAVSPWYQTAPVGGPPQPDYLNGCAVFETTLTPLRLLDILLQTEQQFGRIRRERWGPRSLDLDLLFYAEQIINLPRLTVPHPRMRDRAFVLVPLADIAPHWRDPVTQQTVAQLCAQVDRSGIQQQLAEKISEL
ncbi:MAG: 2-amino-4-hydroxy-6-hydroxymethyldihydropteridine diphosphokinase [Spirulina sp. SIO3F2]|nr:2-amino-4-hydroxy-6-hydroxymethyldihydropteridine diphosphokinase [Spirulina sp. SIO3F2]